MCARRLDWIGYCDAEPVLFTNPNISTPWFRYAEYFCGSAARMASVVASDIAVVLGPRDFEKSTTTSGQAEHIEVVSQPRLLSPPTYGLSGSFRNFQLV